MCQTSCAEGDRTVVSGMTFDDERALYGLSDAVVEGCAFAGPADGESALKECRDVEVRSSRFDLRYPLWHAEEFSMSGCTMSEACRAALWYDRDGRIQDCGTHDELMSRNEVYQSLVHVQLGGSNAGSDE